MLSTLSIFRNSSKVHSSDTIFDSFPSFASLRAARAFCFFSKFSYAFRLRSTFAASASAARVASAARAASVARASSAARAASSTSRFAAPVFGAATFWLMSFALGLSGLSGFILLNTFSTTFFINVLITPVGASNAR